MVNNMVTKHRSSKPTLPMKNTAMPITITLCNSPTATLEESSTLLVHKQKGLTWYGG